MHRNACKAQSRPKERLHKASLPFLALEYFCSEKHLLDGIVYGLTLPSHCKMKMSNDEYWLMVSFKAIWNFQLVEQLTSLEIASHLSPSQNYSSSVHGASRGSS